MRRVVWASLALFFAIGCSLAFAQDKNVNVGRVYVMTPKPGMVKQFEDGRKRHMDWHRKQNDTWRWETWQIETGPNTGSYFSTTFGHTFADFDTWEMKLGDPDAADSATNMQPYLGEGADNGIWMVLGDVSRPPDMSAPLKLAEVNHFLLKPGHEDDFADSAKKINEAINKANWPVHYIWYVLVDGGEAPHYVLLIFMNGWADLAEPDPPFRAMLEKGLGRHDTQAVLHSVDEAVKREWTETIRFRPDLSYIPAGK